MDNLRRKSTRFRVAWHGTKYCGLDPGKFLFRAKHSAPSSARYDLAQHDWPPRAGGARDVAGSAPQRLMGENGEGERFFRGVGDAEIRVRHQFPRPDLLRQH